MKPRAAGYYLRSVATLLAGMYPPRRVLRTFLGLPERRPLVIGLRPSGSRYRVRSAMDLWVIKETCLDRDYEQVSGPLRDGWTVIDIGAGLGDFTVHAARGWPRSTVYAYEPSPESFALLQENLRLNRLTNARAFPLAVGRTAGDTLTLSTGARAAVQHSTAAAADGATVSVPCTSLDAILAEHGIAQCDYLKIDCEGGEYDILFGASAGTLQRLQRVCLEYHDGVTPWSHDDLVTFFHKHGFRTSLRDNPVHTDIGFLYAENTHAVG